MVVIFLAKVIKVWDETSNTFVTIPFIAEGGDDMKTDDYDPQGKKQDIFAYVDAAISGAIGGSY